MIARLLAWWRLRRRTRVGCIIRVSAEQQRELARLGKVSITRDYYVRSGERNIWQP